MFLFFPCWTAQFRDQRKHGYDGNYCPVENEPAEFFRCLNGQWLLAILLRQLTLPGEAVLFIFVFDFMIAWHYFLLRVLPIEACADKLWELELNIVVTWENAHTRTRAHAHTRTHGTHTHTRTYARARARTRAHTRTHSHSTLTRSHDSRTHARTRTHTLPDIEGYKS